MEALASNSFKFLSGCLKARLIFLLLPAFLASDSAFASAAAGAKAGGPAGLFENRARRSALRLAALPSRKKRAGAKKLRAGEAGKTRLRRKPQKNGGFAVPPVKKTDFLARMGLKKNDVIQSLNGESVSSKKSFLSRLRQMRFRRGFSLELERGGRRLRFVYRKSGKGRFRLSRRSAIKSQAKIAKSGRGGAKKSRRRAGSRLPASAPPAAAGHSKKAAARALKKTQKSSKKKSAAKSRKKTAGQKNTGAYFKTAL